SHVSRHQPHGLIGRCAERSLNLRNVRRDEVHAEPLGERKQKRRGQVSRNTQWRHWRGGSRRRCLRRLFLFLLRFFHLIETRFFQRFGGGGVAHSGSASAPRATGIRLITSCKMPIAVLRSL